MPGARCPRRAGPRNGLGPPPLSARTRLTSGGRTMARTRRIAQDDQRSTVRLMLDAVREAGDLAVAQYALLAHELDGIRRTVMRLGSSFGGGLIFLCCGSFLLLVAAVKLLAWLTGSEVLGALIVAAPFIAAAIGLGHWGARKMLSVGRPSEGA